MLLRVTEAIMKSATEVPRSQLSRTGKIVLAAFLVIQVSIPAYALVARWVNEGSRPGMEYRWSWQMYSGSGSGSYEGTLADGSVVPLSDDGLPFVVRAINYGETVPQLLCDSDSDLVSVSRTSGKSGLTVTC